MSDNVIPLPMPRHREPNTGRFFVIFPVSEAMQGRFTNEQLEMGATIALFAQLALDPSSSDDVADEDIVLEWMEARIRYPADSFRKMIKVTANVRPIPQEG